MPTLQEYETAAQAADDKAQFRLTGAGLATRDRTEKMQAFAGAAGTKEQNAAVLRDFKIALRQAYPPDPYRDLADRAFTNAGLGGKEADRGVLSAGRIQQACLEAKNLAITAADEAYKAEYAAHDMDAANWNPANVTSNLNPAKQPGLRFDSVDQGDMRLHGWHPKNRHADGVFELDEAVNAEIALMQDPPVSPRLQNIQARLNLLETMVTQAENNLRTEGVAADDNDALAAQNVFTAPEWLFSAQGLDHTKQDGTQMKVAGGALTEGEMRRITQEVTAMSARHPGMLIMPGTILWSKPADQDIRTEGMKRPADMVFNSAPVVANGKLVHMTNKLNEGFDPELASLPTANTQSADGSRVRKPAHVAPSSGNNFAAREKVFPEDNHVKGDADYAFRSVQSAILAQTSSGRQIPQWEQNLRVDPNQRIPGTWQDGFSPSGQQQTHNNLLQFNNKLLAIDICADHGQAMAVKNLQTGAAGDPLIQRINGQQGVDGHFVIAASANLQPASNCARPNGAYAVNDLSSGNFVSCEAGAGHAINQATKVECFRPLAVAPLVAVPPIAPASDDPSLSDDNSLAESFSEDELYEFGESQEIDDNSSLTNSTRNAVVLGGGGGGSGVKITR